VLFEQGNKEGKGGRRNWEKTKDIGKKIYEEQEEGKRIDDG
jgi:hypothetical protein